MMESNSNAAIREKLINNVENADINDNELNVDAKKKGVIPVTKTDICDCCKMNVETETNYLRKNANSFDGGRSDKAIREKLNADNEDATVNDIDSMSFNSSASSSSNSVCSFKSCKCTEKEMCTVCFNKYAAEFSKSAENFPPSSDEEPKDLSVENEVQKDTNGG